MYKNALVVYTDLDNDLHCTNDHKVFSFLNPSSEIAVYILVGPYYL